MNITKNILNIVGTVLEQEGFTYEKNGRAWEFERKKDDITQHIILLGHRYFAGYIKALFFTNAYGQGGMREFGDFVPEVWKGQEFWEYETEKQLQEILEKFREWIVEYGLDFLDSISVPKESEIYKLANEVYLYEHHEEIYRKYFKEWELEKMEPMEIMHLIHSKIAELYDRDFKDVEKTLIEFAAVYGHSACIEGEGTWIWDDEKKCCDIENIAGTIANLEPLSFILSSYVNKSDILIEKFDNIVKVRNICLRNKRKRKRQV